MRFIQGMALRPKDRVREIVSQKVGSVVELRNGFVNVLFDGETEARPCSFNDIETAP